MPQLRTQFLRTAAVLGVFALAAQPVRAGRVTYSLPDLPPDRTVPAGALTFAGVFPCRAAAASGRMVDPASVYLSSGLMTCEAAFARTQGAAFPPTPDHTRRAYVSFYTPAVTADSFAGFRSAVYPAGGPGDWIAVREILRPPQLATVGSRDPAQKDFPDPVGPVHTAGELVIDARDVRGAEGGAIRRFSRAAEPPSLTLFALGAVGLLGAYWRRCRTELSWPNARPYRNPQRRRQRLSARSRSGWEGARAAQFFVPRTTPLETYTDVH